MVISLAAGGLRGIRADTQPGGRITHEYGSRAEGSAGLGDGQDGLIAAGLAGSRVPVLVEAPHQG